MKDFKLVVGLGNLGKKYHNTRHNIGFLVIDYLVAKLGLKEPTINFHGQLWTWNPNSQVQVFFAKPQTFMNLSGDFVLAISRFYQISHHKILVIYDDVSLPTANLRYKIGGSSGGHRGMGDIINKLQTNDIPRLKVGIQKPSFSFSTNLASFVLGQMDEDELLQIRVIFPKIFQLVQAFLGGADRQIIANSLFS